MLSIIPDGTAYVDGAGRRPGVVCAEDSRDGRVAELCAGLVHAEELELGCGAGADRVAAGRQRRGRGRRGGRRRGRGCGGPRLALGVVCTCRVVSIVRTQVWR